MPNDKKIWGQTIEGCRMSVECDKEEYSYYEKIVLKITLDNTTAKEIRYHDSFAERDFIFSVKNEKGKDTPLTEYGKLVTGKDMLVWQRNMRIMLVKGQPMEYSVPINRMYDMSIGGKYTISVNRSVTDLQAKKKIEIKSNTLSINDFKIIFSW